MSWLTRLVHIDTYVCTYTQRELKWTDLEGAAEAPFILQHTGQKWKELRIVA